MPEFKQVERVIHILQRLAINGETTTTELYEYFDHKVTLRTLQRDLTEISAAGIPIVDEKGLGNQRVWRLINRYLKFIPETIGSQELLASFFLQRLSIVARGTSIEKDIKSLLSKARQLIGPDVFRSTEGFELSHDMFGATFMGYVDYSAHSDKIDRLVKAATECRRCRFAYKRASAEEVSEFEADPYLLLYHKGALYAVVYVEAHDNYIFLPVQRIRSIEETAARFKRRKDFSLDRLREGRFGIFGGPDLKPERVVLRFDRDIAEVVAERVWHPSQKLTRHDDGSLTLEMETVVSDELRAWIGSWLGHVEVVELGDGHEQK